MKHLMTVASRQLRGVIFDMDGVLVDSHAVHRKAWRIFFQTLAREVTDAELDFILDGRKRADILRHFLGDRPEAEIEEFGRRKDCIFRQMQLEVKPLAGAVQILEQLLRRNIPLALATSASRSRAQSTLLQLGLQSCFRSVVTGDDVPHGKPDGCIYRVAATEIGIAHEHLLAMEDSVSGVRSAVSANLLCLGLASHEAPDKLKTAGAVHVIPDFDGVSVDDLESIVQNRCRSAQIPPSGS